MMGTQVPLSVEELADWLRSYANYCDPVGGIRQVDVIRAWASAVESLAAGRIAGQADEAGDLSWEHRERVLAAPQAAQSDLGKDRAEALLREAVQAMEESRRAIGDHIAPEQCYATGPMTGDAIRDLIQCPACSAIAQHDATLAAIRTYLKGEAP